MQDMDALRGGKAVPCACLQPPSQRFSPKARVWNCHHKPCNQRADFNPELPTLAEFDQYAKDHSLTMNRSIGWTGQDHDVLVAKSQMLVSLKQRATP
jgi:hypothetical protein